MIRIGRFQRSLRVRIVQSGEQLSLVHMRALVKEDTRDAAGNLGGNGSAAGAG
jgi:hypothetical protein